jgi:hypothetical protein
MHALRHRCERTRESIPPGAVVGLRDRSGDCLLPKDDLGVYRAERAVLRPSLRHRRNAVWDRRPVPGEQCSRKS